jgi:hypothetical protein
VGLVVGEWWWRWGSRWCGGGECLAGAAATRSQSATQRTSVAGHARSHARSLARRKQNIRTTVRRCRSSSAAGVSPAGHETPALRSCDYAPPRRVVRLEAEVRLAGIAVGDPAGPWCSRRDAVAAEYGVGVGAGKSGRRFVVDRWEASAELAFRAAWLVRERNRRGLARCLGLAIWEAEAGTWSLRVSSRPVRRAEVLSCREALVALCERLESPQAAAAERVAIAELLLTELGSPLFVWAEPGTVRRLARRTAAAMDPP